MKQAVPLSLDPTGGGIHGQRAARKRLQVEALLRPAIAVLDWLWLDCQRAAQTHAADSKHRQPIHVVEFGAGSGHVGLLLAYLRPNATVSLLERKEYSCETAKRRAAEAGLTNVTVLQHELHEWAPISEPFDLGISLHGCGLLTDGALELW